MKLHYLYNPENREEIKKEFKYYYEACDFGIFFKRII